MTSKYYLNWNEVDFNWNDPNDSTQNNWLDENLNWNDLDSEWNANNETWIWTQIYEFVETVPPPPPPPPSPNQTIAIHHGIVEEEHKRNRNILINFYYNEFKKSYNKTIPKNLRAIVSNVVLRNEQKKISLNFNK